MVDIENIIVDCESDSSGYVEPSKGEEFTAFPIEISYSWKGTVKQITQDSFLIELYDPLEDQFAETEYPKSQLQYHQRDLLKVGSKVFLYSGNRKDNDQDEHILLFRKYEVEPITAESLLDRIRATDIRPNIV